MSDLRKAAEMALEALEEGIDNMWSIRRENAIQALRQALAQEHEPVAWMHIFSDGHTRCVTKDESGFVDNLTGTYETIPLYIASPKREWVGLTDDEIYYFVRNTESYLECAKGIEAKLKEKNT